jgi:hypothetical protein
MWISERELPRTLDAQVSRVLDHGISPARSRSERESTAASAAVSPAAIARASPVSAVPSPTDKGPVGAEIVDRLASGAPGCGPMEPLESLGSWREPGDPAATKTDGVFAPPARRTAAPPARGAARSAAAVASRPATVRAGMARPVVRRPPVSGDVASVASGAALRTGGGSPRSDASAGAIFGPDASAASITAKPAGPSTQAARPRRRPSSRLRPPPCDSSCTGEIVSHPGAGRQEKVCRFWSQTQGSEQVVYPEPDNLTEPVAVLH